MAELGIREFVRRELDKTRGSWPEIARVTGLSVHGIRKIAQGQHKNPNIDKLEKLQRYFRRYS